MNGKIIKGVGGFYYVASQGKIYTCRAKGIFRNMDIKPLIGDEVEFSIIDENRLEGNIDGICDRRSSLVRPAVANIDRAILVLAVEKPAPQLFLVDKYLISMEIQNIPVTIVFNKMDLNREKADIYESIYNNAGYDVIKTSTKTGEGIEELCHYIRGKTCAFAGPSGVGKSSITNLICPEAAMETGSISSKIDRGKHTTRHSEFFIAGEDTFLCDTPGFTSIDISSIEADDLKTYMPDIISHEGKCRFIGCRHLAEPDCSVKAAVQSGELETSRYESYKKIYEELSSIRRY